VAIENPLETFTGITFIILTKAGVIHQLFFEFLLTNFQFISSVDRKFKIIQNVVAFYIIFRVDY
tara:strand:- start:12194 stop:12385 length:192 start_codon:yes stop_codon:yes gene_type:complete